MRIKVFERVLPINEVYKNVVRSLESQYEIFNNSQVVNSHFLITAMDSKVNIIIIWGVINEKRNRFFICIDVARPKTTKELPDEDNNSKMIQDYINDLIKELKIETSMDSFENFKLKLFKSLQLKKGLLDMERDIFERVLENLANDFEYNDDLMKYPFSIINKDGSWEEWKKIYDPYLKKIESNILGYNGNFVKTYEYYDFSLPGEHYQRIVDLIAVEKLEYQPSSNKEEENQETMSKEWINLILANKNSKPMRLMKVMKLSEEVRKYLDSLNRSIKSENREIKARLILLSINGFEEKIADYLRENINQDKKYIIPIFVIPPINDEVWHNFRGKYELTRAEKTAKKQAKHYIRIHRQNAEMHNYVKYKVQDAEEKYHNLLEKEKMSKKTTKFLDKWSKILNLESLDEYFDLNTIKEKN